MISILAFSDTSPYPRQPIHSCTGIGITAGEFCSRLASFVPVVRAFLPTVEQDSRQWSRIPAVISIPAFSDTSPYPRQPIHSCTGIGITAGEFCSRLASFVPVVRAFLPTVELDSRQWSLIPAVISIPAFSDREHTSNTQVR